MTRLETVNAFLAAAAARDYDTALPLLADTAAGSTCR